MKLKFNLQFFGGGGTKTQRVQKRDPEPEYLTNLRNKLYGKIDSGLTAFDPASWNKAQNITNNALNTQNSLLSQLPSYLNQSNSILGNIQNIADTGELPSGVTDKLNAGVQKDLQSSMGTMLNNLSNRGIVNSSITSQGISRLGQQAADAYNRNYLNAFNSVLSGQAQALQGSQNNTASLLSGLGTAAQLPSHAYEGATAGLMPAYNFWKDLQHSYDNREDYDTIVQQDSGMCITGDTLVTLSDGRNIPVSELHNDDYIMCWDFNNGCPTFAPLTAFFIHHQISPLNVLRVAFDDNSSVGVIFEHLFFDITLGKFVAVNSDSQDFIGHEFAKLNQDGKIIPVKVTGIYSDEQSLDAYSPQCKGHLNFFANGFISGTGGQLGLCNMFDFDIQNMRFDTIKKEHDLKLYGRLGYSALNDLVSQEFFFHNHCDTFSVAFAKGLISLDSFRHYLARFSHCFIKEVI